MNQQVIDELEQLISLGDHDNAIALCERHFDQGTGDTSLAIRYGQLLRRAGRIEDAAWYLLMLTAQVPDDPAPCKELGRLFEAIGDQEQAHTFYAQALKLSPHDLDLLLLIGRLFSVQGKADEAASFYQEINRIDTTQCAPAIYLAKDSFQLGYHERALAWLERALELTEGHASNRLEAYSLLVFQRSAYTLKTGDDYLRATADYWQQFRSMTVSSGHGPAHPRSSDRPASPDKQLRVGILGGHFGRYVVSTFLESFLIAYNREELCVDLLPTTLHPDSGSQYLASLVGSVHSLDGLTLEQARGLIRDQRYDILVDTSGFTDTTGLQILAERCAAVQCHWIGYHASTGLATIDWFLGDAVFTPEALQDQFQERLWQLPRPWLAISPSIPPPPANASMAQEQPILGSFNQLAKITRSTLDHWAAALVAVPDSLLVIKHAYTVNASACGRIREELQGRGIDPARLTFLPGTEEWQDHLNTYNQIDVALDCTPWSSSTTAFDALSMGVPLVAINGDCASAKMSSSLLTGLGRSEWICRDPRGFAATVAELCRELPALRASKADRQRQVLASPLFDPSDLADHIGKAFRQMHALAGAGAGHFH